MKAERDKDKHILCSSAVLLFLCPLLCPLSGQSVRKMPQKQRGKKNSVWMEESQEKQEKEGQ